MAYQASHLKNSHIFMKSTHQYCLDITGEVCPMTFVKTRLLIEKMPTGATAEIFLKGLEPVENVPASVAELGHDVLALETVSADGAVMRLTIRKNSVARA
jgi:TusA-related sulfurtransferase